MNFSAPSSAVGSAHSIGRSKAKDSPPRLALSLGAVRGAVVRSDSVAFGFGLSVEGFFGRRFFFCREIMAFFFFVERDLGGGGDQFVDMLLLFAFDVIDGV